MKVVIHITMSWWRLTCEACDTCYYVIHVRLWYMLLCHAKVVIHVTMSG